MLSQLAHMERPFFCDLAKSADAPCCGGMQRRACEPADIHDAGPGGRVWLRENNKQKPMMLAAVVGCGAG